MGRGTVPDGDGYACLVAHGNRWATVLIATVTGGATSFCWLEARATTKYVMPVVASHSLDVTQQYTCMFHIQ